MIIQWEFRFPVLRIFRELCKQCNGNWLQRCEWDAYWILFATGFLLTNGQSQNACVIPPAWGPFSQPRLWCALQPRRTTPPSGFRSATRTNMSGSCDSRLLNPNSQLLILTKEREILLQQKVRRLRCNYSLCWDDIVMYTANCRFVAGKVLNFSPRICKMKPKEAKNLDNTHHSWQHLITPQKKDPRSGCSDGFRLRSPIKFILIDATSSMLQKSESDVELFCCQMPKHA